MSRTYRRKGCTRRKGGWDDLSWYTSEYVWSTDSFYVLYRRYYEKDSKEYKKAAARFYSDAGSHNCKEPGPSWFRNLYSDRPLRRAAKNELHKFVTRNGEYEPMILRKGKLPYWT